MKYTDIATRAYICALKASGQTTAEVSFRTGIPAGTINSIYSRAIARGFDPARQPIEIKDSYLADAPRSGRPSKAADPAAVEAVVSKFIRHPYIGLNGPEDPQGSWVQKDQAHEEAWSDEDDEEGPA